MKSNQKRNALKIIKEQAEWGGNGLTPRNYYMNFYYLLKYISNKDTTLRGYQETLDIIIESIYFVESKIRADNKILENIELKLWTSYKIIKLLDIDFWTDNIRSILDIVTAKLKEINCDTNLTAIENKLTEIDGLIKFNELKKPPKRRKKRQLISNYTKNHRGRAYGSKNKVKEKNII